MQIKWWHCTGKDSIEQVASCRGTDVLVQLLKTGQQSHPCWIWEKLSIAKREQLVAWTFPAQGAVHLVVVGQRGTAASSIPRCRCQLAMRRFPALETLPEGRKESEERRSLWQIFDSQLTARFAWHATVNQTSRVAHGEPRPAWWKAIRARTLICSHHRVPEPWGWTQPDHSDSHLLRQVK